MMEDLKWVFRKYCFLFLLVLVVGIVVVHDSGKRHTEDVTEEIWEAPVNEEVSNDAATTEEKDTRSSSEEVLGSLPETSTSLISDKEQEQLQNQALSVAESVSEIYKGAEIVEAPNYLSGITLFPKEKRKEVVEAIGKNGYVSVEENTNMQNYEMIEKFYTNYLNGQDSMFTVFEVQRDGLIGAVTFLYRNNGLQTYYIGIRWQEGGVPEIQSTSVNNIAEIKLTEKGYFIYTYDTIIAHASLRQYWRIKPLSDRCRELKETYIAGLSYVNYNMLVIDWDSSNVEDILMPCMYEDIYRIYTGDNLKTENRKIPAEQYEKIMTTYFPVSIQQLREHCKYDESSNSYEHEMIYASQHPPFGEVMDYTENPDGTITLLVDGVWPDYNSDKAFTNRIIIQPYDDGTFRYLSNSIQQQELELPPIARRKG